MSRLTQDTAILRRTYQYEAFTLYGLPFQVILVHCRSNVAVLLPHICRNIYGLGCFHFARRYFGNRCFFLLLLLLRCFSSEGLLTLRCDSSSNYRVAPFGNPRIKSCLQIPAAFRSLPRPSSPPRAKASPIRSYLLSYNVYNTLLLCYKPLSHSLIMSMNVVTRWLLRTASQFRSATPEVMLLKLSLKHQAAYLWRLAPERRCSSRTFRYGYLVTT